MRIYISIIPLLSILVFSTHAQDDNNGIASDFTGAFDDARSVFGGAPTSSDSTNPTSTFSLTTSSASEAIPTTSSISDEANAISTFTSPEGGVVCYGPAACTKARTSETTSKATSSGGNSGQIAVATGGVAMMTAGPMWGAAVMGAALYFI